MKQKIVMVVLVSRGGGIHRQRSQLEGVGKAEQGSTATSTFQSEPKATEGDHKATNEEEKHLLRVRDLLLVHRWRFTSRRIIGALDG